MSGWIIYALIALSLSLTSYINIYKPALELYLEITEEDNPIISSIAYKIVWVILTSIGAPIIAYMLLKGRNDTLIKDLVIAWLEDNEDE